MSNQPGIEILTDDECWQLLGRTQVGRLAVDVGGQPDIFPINYVVDGETIVFRSGAGTKLAASVLMHHVAFEIDGYEPDAHVAWSVILKGRAELVEKMGDLWEAEDLPLFPWLATPKPNFVRVTPTIVTGRRFHVVDEILPDGSLGWSESSTD